MDQRMTADRRDRRLFRSGSSFRETTKPEVVERHQLPGRGQHGGRPANAYDSSVAPDGGLKLG